MREAARPLTWRLNGTDMHVLRSAMMSATPAPVGLGTWEGEPGVKAGGRVGRESAVRLQRGRYVLSRTNPPPVALWDLEDILGGTLSIRCTRYGCARWEFDRGTGHWGTNFK